MTKPTNSRSQKLSSKFYDQYLAIGSVSAHKVVHPEPESYWEKPQHGGFSIISIDAKDFRSELKQLWNQEPDLQCMIEPLHRLSQSVEETSEADTEISPFIYAMF